MPENVERIETAPSLPPRAADAHKGAFGRVLVVGGSRGMPGAVALASLGALRGGAGLTTFAVPEPIQLAVAGLCPCATSIPLACADSGALRPSAARQVRQAAEESAVLAVGPGMSLGPVQRDIVHLVLGQRKPLVLDADGLNNLARVDNWPQLRRCPVLLTPHPGEFSRLTDFRTAAVQADRETAAVGAVREWIDQRTEDCPPLVCLLKGRGTVVTDGRRVYVNATGNPGMATGGSGDVLTGLAAALIAQGLDLFDAACLAAWAHGRAGDLAAEKVGQVSVIATDLLEYLPQALTEAQAAG